MISLRAATAPPKPFCTLPAPSAEAVSSSSIDPGHPRRLLVVDDDADFRHALALFLAGEGFGVTECSSGQSAVEFVRSKAGVDVMLLDWRMPEMNGLEVLQTLRQHGMTTPTIFLTALSDDVHEEAALSGGAVDYVDKSRISSILVKRIELIAARQKTLPDSERQNEVQLGGLTLRFEAHRALWQGAAVDLTHTEFRMVSRLALRAGEDVAYRELYDLVHGKGFVAGCGEHGYRTNVRTFIKRIRKKFRAIDPSFSCIENYGGFGYRWAVR